MTVTISLQGSSQLMAALREASDEIRDAAQKAVVGTALELQGDVKQRIQRGPASGRTYRKYSPNRVHTASAPGQAPMSDTGGLARSITFDTDGPLSAIVGSTVIYAMYLEYGTRRMAARPFFTPAVEEMRPRFNARLERAISGAIR